MARTTGVKILWGLFDPTAKDDARLSASAGQPFSSLSDVQNNTAIQRKYATLEQDQIVTDGNFIPFPNHPVNMGWWSKELSDNAGRFSNPPFVEAYFEEYDHSAIGITIEFSEAYQDWPGETRIQWFDVNNLIVAFGTFYPNRAKYFFARNAENFRRIRIDFLGTHLPYRYLKIANIDYGYLHELRGGENLISADIKREISPISASIPIHELKFQFFSDSIDFSPLNPEGVYKFLQQRQQIDVFITENGIEKDMGTFYLDKWTGATAQSVSLRAVDILGVMDTTDFVGGMYDGETANKVIGDIFKSAEVNYNLEQSLRNIPIYGHIPICSHREALQYVLFRIGGIAHRDKGSTVEIIPRETQTKATIDISRKLSTQIQQHELVTGAMVVGHSFTKTNESIELYNEYLTPGEYPILFSEPAHTITASGAQILFSNVNMAKIRVANTQTVIINGKKYLHNKRTGTYEVSRDISGSAPNIVKVESATLIEPESAANLAKIVYEYYQNRHEMNIRFFPEDETTGDIVVAATPDGGRLRGYIEAQSYDLIGGYIVSGTISGIPIEISHGAFMSEFYMGDEEGIM